MKKIKYIFITFIFLLAFILPNQTHGFMFEATDVLGQIDQDGNPAFDQGYAQGKAPDDHWNTHRGFTISESLNKLFVAPIFEGRILIFDINPQTGEISNQPSNVLGQDRVDEIKNPATYNNRQAIGRYNDSGLAFDENNQRLFVPVGYNPNIPHRRIMVYDLSSGISNNQEADWVLGAADFDTTSNATSQFNISRVKDVEYDQENDRLFASDWHHNRVMVWDLSAGITSGMNAQYVLGQENFTSNVSGTTQNRFDQPRGLSYSQQEELLFVTDVNNNRVMVFDVREAGSLDLTMCGETTTGIAIDMNASCVIGQNDFTSNTSGLNDSSFNFIVSNFTPDSMSAYSDKHKILFVTDDSNNRVLSFDLSAGITNGMSASNVLGQSDFNSLDLHPTEANTFAIPGGVMINPKNLDELVITDSGNNRILFFDIANLSDNMPAQRLHGGTTYIDENGDMDFNATGVEKDFFHGQGELFDVFYDNDDQLLFVSDSGNNRVLIYDFSSGFSRVPKYVLGQSNFNISSSATSVNGLSRPVELHYESQNSHLFVADSDNNRVMVWDLSAGVTSGMNAQYVLGQSDFQSSNTSHFDGPEGLSYDSKNNNLFVEQGGGEILIFDLSGGIQNGMNHAFSSFGEDLSHPRFSFNEKHGLLFSTSYSDDKVFIYDVRPEGSEQKDICGKQSTGIKDDFSYVCSLGDSSGVSKSGVHRPQGIHSVGDKVFITSVVDNRVLFFDLSKGLEDQMESSMVFGQSDFVSDGSGLSNQKLNASRNVFFDEYKNRLFVADAGNSRVLIFDLITTNEVKGEVDKALYAPIAKNHQGDVSYQITEGQLPKDLSFSNPTIKGAPRKDGTFQLSVELTDQFQNIGSFTTTKILNIIINPKPVDSTPSNSIEGQVKNLISIGNKQAAQKSMDAYPHLFVDKRKGLSREQSSAIIGFLASFGVSESILENVASVLTN